MSAAAVKIATVLIPIVVSTLASVLPHVIRKIRRRPSRPPRPPRGMTSQEMVDRARNRLNMDVVNYLNFAFCGPQGSGKSTLINSLRALSYTDEINVVLHDVYNPAPTGETETTRATRCYGWPIGHDLEFLRLWDLAGCGTQNHPSQTYFDDKVLFAFDCILLITDGGLGEYERKIIQAAREYGTDVVIVVNKAEQRVESKIRRRPRAAGPLNENIRRMIIQETIDEAKTNIIQDLILIRQEPVPVFVISAWKWYEYENTQNENDMAMAMEVPQLFEHLINTALARRTP